MITPLERIQNLLSDLRMAQVDFDSIFAGQNDLTPLEAVERFLLEQQRMRTEKQSLLRRRRAALPAERRCKALISGSRKACPRSKCSA